MNPASAPANSAARAPDTYHDPGALLLPVVALQNRVAAYFGLTRAELLGPTRGSRTVSWARGLACYLTREELGLSYPELGRAFNRDQSTINYAVRATRRRLQRHAGVTAAPAQVRALQRAYHELKRRDESCGPPG